MSDTLARTDYGKGDIITVVAMAHSFPNENEDYGVLSFEVAPPEVVEKITKKYSEPCSAGDRQGRAATGN